MSEKKKFVRLTGYWNMDKDIRIDPKRVTSIHSAWFGTKIHTDSWPVYRVRESVDEVRLRIDNAGKE